ncbi:MAG TPA: DUF1844 domain-containing protein [Candidatus Ozemobacteraceae bacterium]|nr:DUF1844 domain-containing protein [Candidatus Ozemobacteraceae bacterium]
MDDSSVIKIADRRAAHTEDAEEPKPAPVQASPKKEESAGSKRDASGAQPVRPPASETPSDVEDQPPFDEQAEGYPAEGEEEMEEPPRPSGPGQTRRRPGGMRGPSLTSMHVVETAGFMMEILLQKAFITMGLIPNPETGRRERDLGQTRIAIDLLSATAEQMRGRWGMPGVEQDIEAQLTSLRLQYARMAPPDAGKA